jgi:hypothetical protein
MNKVYLIYLLILYKQYVLFFLNNYINASKYILHSKLEIYRKFTVIFRNVNVGKYKHFYEIFNIFMKNNNII